jgi:hypothetical protein
MGSQIPLNKSLYGNLTGNEMPVSAAIMRHGNRRRQIKKHNFVIIIKLYRIWQKKIR